MPLTTKLSIRLLLLLLVEPLKTIRNAAFGLLFSAAMLVRSKEMRLKLVGGLKSAPKSVKVTPSVLY